MKKGSVYLANRNYEVGELYMVTKSMGESAGFYGNIIMITNVDSGLYHRPEYIIVVDHRHKHNGEHDYLNLGSRLEKGLIKLNPKELFPEKEISVTFHGNTTVAKLKENSKVVKTGVAKCHPEDKYDALYGACCAMGRVFNEEVDVPKTYTAEEAVGMILSVYYNKVRGNIWCGMTGLSEEIVDKALNIIMEEFMKEYQ